MRTRGQNQFCKQRDAITAFLSLCADRLGSISGGPIRDTQLAVECRGWPGNSSRITAPRPSCDLLNVLLDTITHSPLLLVVPQSLRGSLSFALLFARAELTHLHAPVPCPMNAYSHKKFNRVQPHHGDRLCRVSRRRYSRCRVLSTKDPEVFEDSFG